MGPVELRVSHDGAEILVYTMKGTGEAAEMIGFLSGFLPGAEFLVQPVRH